MNSSITVAAVSARNLVGHPDKTIAHYDSWISRIQKINPNTEVFLFPELGLTGFWNNIEILDLAEEVPGTATEQLSRVAKDRNVAICAGIAERENDRYYITQIMIGPEGFLGKYQKVTLNLKMMGRFFSCGSSFPVFDYKGFRFGINICKDNGFGMNAKFISDQHADVLLAPSTSGNGTAKKWTDQQLPRSQRHAKKCGMTIVACNHSGDKVLPDGSCQAYPGGFFAIDPGGEVIERSQQVSCNDEEYVLVEINKDGITPTEIVKPNDSDVETHFKQLTADGHRIIHQART